MTIKTIATSLLLSFALAACASDAEPDESTGRDEAALSSVTPNETIQWVDCGSINATCPPGSGQQPTNCRVYTRYDSAGHIIGRSQQYTCVQVGGGGNN